MGDGAHEEASSETRSTPRDENLEVPGFPVVGIGASAGGLEAVSHLLRKLPRDLRMALAVVQHLDPAHDSSLVELLSRVSPLPVREAADGLPLEPGRVYVIPPNTGMILRRGSLHLTPRNETRDPRRPIDLFLRSLAEESRSWSIGVVLSGTGSDGTSGLEAIRAEGGITFAQDATAAYRGMPTSAISAGCVDYVLPAEGIASELVRLSRHASLGGGSLDERASPSAVVTDDTYDAVVRRLSDVSGVDFANYKQATLRRRIQRRMAVGRIERLESYLALVEKDPAEADALCRDVLINVTSFFRDPAVFEAVKQSVFPAILGARSADTPIRIWVPGCATGEEVYSLAIALLEFLGPRSVRTEIKLFGTDVSDSVIAQSRSGRYPERIEPDVGPERLRRFFVKEDGGYLICKAVRDLCIFARQDATRDPPFSNLDLISCRNVLIYLGSVLQKRVLPSFHYALRDGGFLLLGTSETVGAMEELFAVVDGRRRIYVRRPVVGRMVCDISAGERTPAKRGGVVPDVAPVASRIDFLREADRVLLATFAPPGVLIDDALEILQYRGETGTFLTPAPGTPSNNLRRMARDGLFPDLGEAIEGARSKNATFRRPGLRVKTDAGHVEADIEVIPIHPPLSSERRFLVLFRQVAPPAGAMPVVPGPAESEPAPDVDRERIAQLERELASNKEYLRAILEEREATNEELRAANEELLSSNEELQSTNEELQTAHEELQATNEELLTVNEELQNRNEQATRLTDDLTNLLSSVQLPIVMLGLDLRIRRFTPSAAKLLNLTPSDLDRPILDLKPKFDVQDLGTLLAEVMETKVERQREVQDREGHWYSLWIRPYRTQNNRVEGAVIVLSDVDELKRGAQRLRQARDFAESIVMTVREPLLVLDSALRVVMANNAVRETFGTVPAAIPAAGQEERAAGQWRIPGLLEKIEEVWARGSTFEDFEVEAEFPELGRRFVRMNARRVQGDAEEQHLILLAIEDVTDRRRAEAESALVAEKFHEAQRLESLGVLAGGIAHDFNNILAAILGYAELVQTELPPGSRLRPHVENIEKSAGRAADLCRQILAYSGRGRFVVQPLNLSALVEDLTPLLRATASKKAVFRFELDDALPAVMGDAAQLNQVAMNLVINASEALGNEGGTIIVRTGRMRADRDYLAAARVSPGNPQNDYVYLEVADDGCGMDSDTLARAFDPFFSRKLAGRGVGLSAVLGIVRGHQGALKIDSEPGRGTNFRVLFPAVDSPAKAVARPTPGEATWRGQGTVLIVDDEDAFRAPLKQMLGRLGFRVLEAADGRSGVEAFRAAANQIDVVLLDLTMPHMDGAQTFHELRKLRPSARVILMSGYDERQTMEGFAAQGLAGFLQKPFHYADLTETLRKVLEGDPRKPKPQ